MVRWLAVMLVASGGLWPSAALAQAGAVAGGASSAEVDGRLGTWSAAPDCRASRLARLRCRLYEAERRLDEAERAIGGRPSPDDTAAWVATGVGAGVAGASLVTGIAVILGTLRCDASFFGASCETELELAAPLLIPLVAGVIALGAGLIRLGETAPFRARDHLRRTIDELRRRISLEAAIAPDGATLGISIAL